MPIYAYRCESCGFTKDVLQKVSDAPLTDCPSCSKSSFKKQLTAAGFQLKGTGWYVTDFRNGSGGTSAPAGNTTAPADKPAASSDAGSASTSTSGTAGTASTTAAS